MQSKLLSKVTSVTIFPEGNHIMKNNKHFLFAVLPVFAMSLLAGCNNASNNNQDKPKKEPIDIGDTVREWKSTKDLDGLPIDLDDLSGSGSINKKMGHEDKCSLYYQVRNAEKQYVGSDLLEIPYFIDDDAGNGDVISLYVYIPKNSNILSLELEVLPASMKDGFKSEPLLPSSETEEKWIRLMTTFDSLETLGAIRLNYEVNGDNLTGYFYVDDINITLGEETVKTDYEYNDESLYKAYEDYFKVGACMSGDMLKNNELRKIAKHNFNSLTAENEAKPERILDQQACQELAKTDDTAVAISVAPFEKIYDFCEAHHIGVRHHTFVWFDQTPQWFFRKGYKDNGELLNKTNMLKRMENFIKVTLETVNQRWPGLVYAIDVSNEAVQDGKIRTTRNNSTEPNYWYKTVGDEFVYYAFKYARMYATEDQKLYYNDYVYDYNTNYCKFALETLLKSAIAQMLIDGVGIQGHTDSDQDMEAFITNAKMIKEQGLECQITELDITVNGTSDNDYAKQKAAFKRLVSKVLQSNEKEETNVTAIVVWGITDNNSWKRNQNPLLFSNTYGKKPAYYGFLEALESVKVMEEQ